jgi:TPR repeat protein
MPQALWWMALALMMGPQAWAATATPDAAPQVSPQTRALIDAASKAYAAGDTQGALQMLRPAGQAASREAQYTLGLMLESLPGATAAQYAESANWYYRAALAGHPAAMNNLAALHHDGLGVPVTLSVARIWYERAAKLGFAPSQYNLALMHGRGIGMPREDARMLALLQQAAATGYAPAEAQLGLISLEGLAGQPADAKRAADWFGRAARQGHAEAQYRLGLLLMSGRGLPRDTLAATTWLRAAADQDHTLAAWEAAHALEAAWAGSASPAMSGMTGTPAQPAAPAGRSDPSVETPAGTAGDKADLAATALAYYKDSATAGHVPAMQRLLRLYQEGGLGQPPAPSLASFWKLRLQMAASKAARPGAASSPITSTPQRSAR